MIKRKITFIVHSLTLGGAQRVLTTLANNLTKNYEVSIITFIRSDSFYALDKEVNLIPCFNNINPSSNPIEAIKSNYALLKKINIIVKENKTDLIISFMTTANILGIIIGRFNKIPIIISERTNPYHQKIPKFWSILRSFCYRYSDMLIVQTETIKKFFKDKVDESKLLILPNPISNELTKNRNLNSLTNKGNIILTVGRLTPLKSHAMLIRAFALTEYEKWELWIAGDGPEYQNLESLISELNLDNHVKLLGLVKDVHTLYNTAKVFAFSSTYEGFPNVLIEAMHFGLACVSTDCPTGPSELINSGENGYLVPVNDIDEMRDKLTSLMNNQTIIKQFGKKSMITVQKYEEENVISQWKSVINPLLQYRKALPK